MKKLLIALMTFSSIAAYAGSDCSMKLTVLNDVDAKAAISARKFLKKKGFVEGLDLQNAKYEIILDTSGDYSITDAVLEVQDDSGRTLLEARGRSRIKEFGYVFVPKYASSRQAVKKAVAQIPYCQ